MSTSLDPTTLSVLKGSLEQIADEMDAIIVRSAFSPVISEQKDRAAGIFHPTSGEVIAQGSQTLPIFVTAMQFSVQGALAEAERLGGFREGDIWILNNPYIGGTHLPDVKLVMPVFVDGKLIALLASSGHFNDIGGSTPGGFAPGATEIYQEGVIINPIRLYRQGELQEDILRLLLDNIRLPEEREGDLQALISALRVGGERLAMVVGRYGHELIAEAFTELNDLSEAHMRRIIRDIPDGSYRFEDAIDNDGHSDVPIKLDLTLTIKGDTAHFDFSRSSPPARGPLNIPKKTTIAACQIGFKHIFPQVAINGGCFRPFTYDIPDSVFLGVGHPFPTSGYFEAVGRVISVVIGALSRAIPHLTPADSFGTNGVLTVSGKNETTGRLYVMMFPGAGGYGGNPDGEGLVHGASALGGANFPSIESIEHRLPIRVDKMELREGSGGRGKFDGGCGTIYSYTALADGVSVVALGDRMKYKPYGLNGGEAGAGAELSFVVNGKPVSLPFVTKGRMTLNRGDRMEYRSPGGGGYGTPDQRSSESRVDHAHEAVL